MAASTTASSVASATVPHLSAESVIDALPSVQSRYRRVGMRLSCLRCEVAWTGSGDSECWVCGGPGIAGPPPSIYPDGES